MFVDDAAMLADEMTAIGVVLAEPVVSKDYGMIESHLATSTAIGCVFGQYKS